MLTLSSGPPGRVRAGPTVVLGVAGAAGITLSFVVAHRSLIVDRWSFLLLMALWVPIWLIGAAAARALPLKPALGAIVVLAALLRLAALSGTPSISNDLYRYAWDAHVQLAGIDPYLYPPKSPALDGLRTPEFWPSPARCRSLLLRPGCTVLNRGDVRTIYPAVAEGWFVIVRVVTLGAGGPRPWELAGGAVDVATIVLIARFLRDTGSDPRRVAWYALSPLPVVEFAANGHVDGLALLLLVAAIMALRRGQRGLAGVLVGMATMVKIYPALALVGLWRRGRWRLVGAAAATAVVTELPHVIVVGSRVLGYLPGYLKEEHYSSGGRFLLVGLSGLPPHGQIALAFAVLGAVSVFVWRGRLEPGPAVTILLGALILITTPVQPWYAVTVAGLGCMVDAPWWVLLAIAAEPYYATVILADPHQVGIGRLCYGSAALGIVGSALIRRRSGSGAFRARRTAT